MRRGPVAVLRECAARARPAGAAVVSPLRPPVARRTSIDAATVPRHRSRRPAFGRSRTGDRRREAVHRLKFSGWRGVGDALAAALAALGPPPADAVTWVPLAPRRRAERGFDQAACWRERSRGSSTSRRDAFVRRTKATAPQARRTREERLRAMADAFARIPRRTGAGARPARRRRPDDGCDGLRLRRSARRGGSTRDPPPHGVPLVHRPAARTSRFAPSLRPCLYSGGAPVRVCGCPGINPGSRCQPRAKRPT